MSVSVPVCLCGGRRKRQYRQKDDSYVGVDFRPAYTFPTNGFFKGVNAAQTPVRKTFSGHVNMDSSFRPTLIGGKYTRMPYRESEWDIILSSILKK